MFDEMFEIFNENKKGGETEISRPSPNSLPARELSPVQSNVFVVSVGGSILVGSKQYSENVSAIASCLNDLIRLGCRLVLVVGGGKTARDYVSAARVLGANNFELDELGIKATRLNASLLITAIENAHPEVLANVKRAAGILAQGKTPVFGGITPGFTTDAVAALIAEYLGGTFVNLSDVDGIFTADPAVHSSAVMYREIGYGKLFEILLANTMKPGQNLVVDLPAAMVLKRSGITAFFLNGHDTENIKAAVLGSPFKGTIVRPGAEELLCGESPRPGRRHTAKRKPARKNPARKRLRFYEDGDDGELDPDKIRF